MIFYVFEQVEAFDVNLLANNKEAYSRELTKQDLRDTFNWSSHHPDANRLEYITKNALRDTFNVMESIDTTCDLGLVRRLEFDAIRYQIIKEHSEMVLFVQYLRITNLIDDLLLRILKDSLELNDEINKAADKRLPSRPFNLHTPLNRNLDYAKLYEKINKFPDDFNACTLDAVWEISTKLKYKSDKDLYKQLSKLNYIAFKKDVISLRTFNKLESIRNKKALSWPVYFKRYADVINNAKDKLASTPLPKGDSHFPVEFVSRRDGLTQRGNLYRKYSSTQIMVLAQIIEKTAKRMDAKRTTIDWQYTDDPHGEHDIYVLSPMEQYRLAIKMLRKDMAEVMRSETFTNTIVDYDHIISAAYETGFVKPDELEYVLKFEEFWNPKNPRWKAYAQFAFSLAGTASYYLPPPWNFIGAIGLVLTQTKLLNGDQAPDSDENWNVII